MIIDLPKRVAKNISQFTGRAWLLPKLLEWWDKRKDERIFLLTSGPGTGKSMILAWLTGFGGKPRDAVARSQLARLRGAVKAVYFCQSTSLNTPRLFAESVANQLANAVTGYPEALASILEDRVQIVGSAQAGTAAAGSTLVGVEVKLTFGTVGDEFGFDQAFVRPLRKLYKSGYVEPMLLLVDALDNAQFYTGTTLSDLLSRASDLPAQVRILATTREDPRVLKFFHAIKPVDLVKDADADVDDVQTYAERRLTKLRAIAKSERKRFAQRLAKQASGVFLYAKLVLDKLLAQSPAELPDLGTYLLPAGLSGFYHQLILRELGKDEHRWFDLYEPLLGLIAVAQGEGLTGQDLTDIVGKDIRFALRACKQYLDGELPEGPFRPFHRSLADFLLEEKNSDFHIDAVSMHRRISRFFLHRYESRWGSCSSDYALRYLPTHLLKTAGSQVGGPDYELTFQALTKLLGDFDFACSKIRLVGVDELIEDLQAGQKIISPSGAGPVAELMSILAPEARSLQWWSQNADVAARLPNFPAQQLYNRALQLEAHTIAIKAKSKLDQLAEPYLMLRWRAGTKTRSSQPGAVLKLLLLPLFLPMILAEKESHPTALTISHDGRYVAFGYADATVEVVDLSSGKSVKRFSVPGKSVIMLAGTDGGLVSASSDGKFTFWEPETWDSVRTVALPTEGKLRAARITEDEAKAITVAESREISLWNLETRKRVRLLSTELSLRALALSDEGRYAIAGEGTGAPWVWNLKEDEPARQLAMPVLASGEPPGFWGLVRDFLAAKFVGGTAVAISRNGNLAASVHLESGLNSIIILWDPESGESLRQIPCPKQMVQCVRMSGDGRRAIVAGATSSMTGAIRIFDTEFFCQLLDDETHGERLNT